MQYAVEQASGCSLSDPLDERPVSESVCSYMAIHTWGESMLAILDVLAPLLEQEGHANGCALIAQRSNPVRMCWPCI